MPVRWWALSIPLALALGLVAVALTDALTQRGRPHRLRPGVVTTFERGNATWIARTRVGTDEVEVWIRTIAPAAVDAVLARDQRAGYTQASLPLWAWPIVFHATARRAEINEAVVLSSSIRLRDGWTPTGSLYPTAILSYAIVNAGSVGLGTLFALPITLSMTALSRAMLAQRKPR